MGEDLVIKSYREQINESILKADAVEKAGFNVIIDSLNRKNINTKDVVNYFNRIKSASSMEELDKLTIGELNKITEALNKEITEALISPVEISEKLIREGARIAKEESPTGKVENNDKYMMIGNNLGAQVNEHGIAFGVNQAIRNYCTQKIYQIEYGKKIKEKEEELGLEAKEKKETTSTSGISHDANFNSKKEKFLSGILNTTPISSEDSFEVIKENYIKHLSDTISNLESYK